MRVYGCDVCVCVCVCGDVERGEERRRIVLGEEEGTVVFIPVGGDFEGDMIDELSKGELGIVSKRRMNGLEASSGVTILAMDRRQQ